MKDIFSPYRICPIGAHIDHQGGPVLGRTLAIGTTLTYEALPTREIWLASTQFGETRFFIGDEIDRDHWARYAHAAARVLDGRLRRGLRAHIDGALAGAGLSSSASVGLAYLEALADVNNIDLPPGELIQLDFELENGQLGLQNGILDPMTIVYGQKDALLYMDTITATATAIPDPADCDAAWIVAYSGVSRELTKSGFNVRVAECHEAAALLVAGAWKLSDVPQDVFEVRKKTLPAPLERRAAHFFGEVERVHNGKTSWASSDWVTFGALMNRSCASSISLYESGSPILIELHEHASDTPGVFGSRFSGGGYGGCVVALAKREQAEEAAAVIGEKFSARHPGLPSKVFVAGMGDGLIPTVNPARNAEKVDTFRG